MLFTGVGGRGSKCCTSEELPTMASPVEKQGSGRVLEKRKVVGEFSGRTPPCSISEKCPGPSVGDAQCNKDVDIAARVRFRKCFAVLPTIRWFDDAMNPHL